MFSHRGVSTVVRATAMTVAIALMGSACSGGNRDGAERDRNVSTASVSMSCSKAGQVKSIAGRKMICGQSTMMKNSPKQWFVVAAQKKWVCRKRGIPRYLNGVLSICGTVKKRTFWHTTVQAQAIALGESATPTIAPETTAQPAQATSTMATSTMATSTMPTSTMPTAAVATTSPTTAASPATTVATSATTSATAVTSATTQTTASITAAATTTFPPTTLTPTTPPPTPTTVVTTTSPPTTTPAPVVNALKVGDTGPGGGIVFLTPQSEGNLTGKYFEAAPVTWYAPFGCTDPTALRELNTQAEVGQGAINSGRITTACGVGTSSAAGLANAMTYAGLTDWVLPSINELRALYAVRDKASCKSKCSTGFGTGAYWSSTIQVGKEPLTLNFATSGTLAGLSTELDRTSGAFIRAVRSFS